MVDLEKNEPFEVGACVVVPRENLVIGPRGRETLARNHMATLVILSRFAPDPEPPGFILEAVWDTKPSPGVLPNAITRLRKVFHSVGGPPDLFPAGEPYRLNYPVNLENLNVPPSGSCPFVGLRAFDRMDRIYFAGRQNEVEDISAQLNADNPFLLLVGASGCGKSSLIRAGVLPFLEINNRCQVHYIDVRRLQKLDLDLPEPNPNSAQVVALDHLEAMFAPEHSDADRSDFVNQLVVLRNSKHSRVLAAMRADRFNDLAKFPDLARLAGPNGTRLVTTLSGSSLRDAIQMPALRAGLEFEAVAASSVTLADKILEDVQGQQDPLPLLSVLMVRLYDHKTTKNVLTNAAYTELGGFGGCLAQHAEDVYNLLPVADQAAVPSLLLMLCHQGTTQIETGHCDQKVLGPAQQRVAQHFVTHRLLSAWQQGASSMVSLSHEALLRHWPRASRLLKHHRSAMQTRDNLRLAMREWQAAQYQPEFLLSSGPAKSAAALTRDPNILLSKPERHFIARSNRSHHLMQRLKQTAVAALLVLLTGLTFTAWRLDTVVTRTQVAEQEASDAFNLLENILRGAEPKYETGVTDPLGLMERTKQTLADNNYSAAVQVKIAVAIADIYRQYWQLESVAQLLDDAAKKLGQEPKAAPELFASLDNAQGKLAYYQRDWSKAHALYVQAQNRLDQGTNPALQATINNNLGEWNLAQGNFDAAINFHTLALQQRQFLYGQGHAKIGESLQNLAGAHRGASKLDKAEGLYLTAIDELKKHLGQNHVEVATAQSNLSVLYIKQGKLEQAAPLAEQAYAIRVKVFGKNHPQSANSLHNVAALMLKRGQFVEAEALLKESIELHQQLFGAQHIAIASGLNNLGTLYIQQEEYKQAEATLERAVSSFEDSNPLASHFWYNLADAKQYLGDYAEAEAAVTKAMSLISAQHPDLDMFKTLLALTQHKLGIGVATDELLLQPLARLAQTKGDDSAAFATAKRRAEQVLELNGKPLLSLLPALAQPR